MSGLIRFSIRNFRGIVEFEAAPNGKSLTITGKNGSGKTACLEALFWSLGGTVDGDVLRNGAETTEVQTTFEGYQVTRRLKRGGKPSLTVKDAENRTYGSPTALLSGFIGAISRRTFSTMPPDEQRATLLKLAPGLDVADLDTQREKLYEDRRQVGRRADELKATAAELPEPGPLEAPGEEVPLSDLRARRQAARQQEAENLAVRNAAVRAREDLAAAGTDLERARKQTKAAQEALRKAAEAEDKALQRFTALAGDVEKADAKAAALVDPDHSALDAEEIKAEQHNQRVRDLKDAWKEADRQRAAKIQKVRAAEFEQQKYADMTARLKEIDDAKALRLAAVRLPVAGLGVAGKVVTYDDGTHGPVPVAQLNSAARLRLDVVIGAALGHRLVAARDASLLDGDTRAEIERFAAEQGIQLISEVVSTGEPLTAVIEEAEGVEESEAAAQVNGEAR